MKPAETAQVEFIKDLLRKGGKRVEILAKFVKQWHKLSVRTFDRRLKQAEQQLHQEQQRIRQQSEALVTQAINQRADKILSSIDRQVLLTKIALGELEVTSKEPRYDPMQRKFVMVPVVQPPSIGDRLRAMAELNKMNGDYKAQQIDVQHRGDTSLPSWLNQS